jgi:hypothetical protein
MQRVFKFILLLLYFLSHCHKNCQQCSSSKGQLVVVVLAAAAAIAEVEVQEEVEVLLAI